MTVYSRVKAAYVTTAETTVTVALDGAAAPAGSLLVAIVFARQAVTSNSWGATALAGSGNNGALNYQLAYARPTDGTVKDFTVTTAAPASSPTIAVVLLEFPGYVSAARDSGFFSAMPSSTSVTIDQGTPTVAAKTVTLALVTLSSTSGGFGAPSNGFEAVPIDNATALALAVRANTAVTQPAVTIGWPTARAGRVAMWSLQGIAATTSTPTPGAAGTSLRRGSQSVKLYRGASPVRLYRGAQRLL